tara:strand:- start:3617 stop:3931 length:315 start_codon:yes stop_codon:yes gene_type:complete
MKGTVKFFNGSKGFGFIAAEDGKEYFVHISGLREGEKLYENDSVTFDVEEGERGPKAVNVVKVDSAEETSEESEEATEESDEDSEEPAEEAEETEEPAEEDSEE